MNIRGQGALEYLLLIGGAVLVGTIVLLVVLATVPATNTIISDNITTFDNLSQAAGLSDTPAPDPVDLIGSITLENTEIALSFSDVPVGVNEITYHPDQTDESVFALSTTLPLWEAYFMDTISPNGIVGLTSASMCNSPVTYSQWVSGTKQLLELYWNDCPVSPGEFVDVTLHAELANGSARVLWGLSVKNNTTHYGVDRAALRWNISRKSSGDRLLVPTLSGTVISDPAANITATNNVWWSTFTQMQAYYNVDTSDNSGILLYSMDPKHNRAKHRGWSANGGNTTSIIMSEYGDNPLVKSDFSFPYYHAMETFSGDWYDAAQLYRAWVQTTPIVSSGKLLTRGDVPAWYKEMGFHLIQNYAPTVFDTSQTGEQDPLAFFKKIKDYYLPCDEYQSTPCGIGQSSQEKMGLFEWNWYQNQYNSSTGEWSYSPIPSENQAYGEYEAHPAFDGAASFATAASTFGINVMGYTLSFAHAVNSPNYVGGTNLVNEACLGAALTPQIIVEGNASIALMKHDSAVWQNHYATAVKQNLADNGFKGVYLDNPYFVGEGCYNPTKTTPQGEGGTYIFDGFRNLMMTIQNTAHETDPNFILFYENGSETFLPVADSFANYGQNDLPMSWVRASAQQPVPLMETLYHDYTLFTAGNTFPSIALQNYFAYQGFYPQFPEAMRASLSAGFVRGKIPLSSEPLLNIPVTVYTSPVDFVTKYDVALHEYQDNVSNLQSYTEFLKTAVKVRKSEAKKYLIYGQLVRPLTSTQFAPPTRVFTFYTTPTPTIPSTPFTVTFPEVMHSVWKASDGKIGLLFINYTATTQNIPLNISPNAFTEDGLSAISSVKQLNIGGINAPVSTVVFTSIPSLPSTINLPSGGMAFYELS